MNPSSTLARKKPIQTLVPMSQPAQYVDAVVPVAGAQERQAVLAEMLERIVDGEPRVLIDGRALARGARNDDPRFLASRHGFAFEEWRRLVEHGSIAAFAHIARQHVGQPQMRVARLGPLAEARAAAGRAMPPLEHVAFAKLLARVQHDLRAAEPRLEENERQHVLQLVAIAGRPPSWFGPTRPNSREA